MKRLFVLIALLTVALFSNAQRINTEAYYSSDWKTKEKLYGFIEMLKQKYPTVEITQFGNENHYIYTFVNADGTLKDILVFNYLSEYDIYGIQHNLPINFSDKVSERKFVAISVTEPDRDHYTISFDDGSNIKIDYAHNVTETRFEFKDSSNGAFAWEKYDPIDENTLEICNH